MMRISIFITSYNQKEYLKEAIESALSQTLQPSQIIVVDDCSTDGSRNLIKAFKRTYPHLIDPIFHTVNTGVTQGRIDALDAVTGDYVTYLDGDDLFHPQKLEREAGTLVANRGVDIVYSNNDYVSEDGKHLWTWIDGETPPEGDVFCETFARTFPRKSLFRMELVNYQAWENIGFHDRDLRLYEDFDMRIRLTKYLKVAYCPHVLSEIRLHGRGLSSSDLDHHFHALKYIYEKNQILLNDISTRNRKTIKDGYMSWLAKVGMRGALSSLIDRDIARFIYLLTSSIKRDPRGSLSTLAESLGFGIQKFFPKKQDRSV